MMRRASSLLFTSALALAFTAPAAYASSKPAMPVQAAEAGSAASSAPVHTYRLLFTVTESDSGKKVGVQHFAMTAVAGQRASMKQGSKVPVATGFVQNGASPDNSTVQFTYIDVGLNCSATLTERADGVEAAIKIEQSSVADTPSLFDKGDVKEPIFRQAVLENASLLKLGKPVMIGSLDVPGSTRHLDIEVTLERVM